MGGRVSEYAGKCERGHGCIHRDREGEERHGLQPNTFPLIPFPHCAPRMRPAPFSLPWSSFARLQLFEGVVLFYSRDLREAATKLAAAEAMLAQLDVADEQLAQLQQMGESQKGK
jgi:hypothetical protein